MIVAIIVLSLIAIVSLSLLFITNKRMATEADASTRRFDEECARHDEEVAQMRREHDAALSQALENTERYNARLTELTADNARLTERIAIFEGESGKRRAEEENRFKALASEILQNSSSLLREQQAERLNDILKPLHDNIDRFSRSVTECYDREARERFSLMKSIEDLIKTNNTIGEEAKSLSRALRGDSKVQGDWGEMILESILEKSGLRKDEEFFVQVTRDEQGNTLRDEQGHNLRPDVVVKYPGGKSLVIDSKVSLTSYIELVNSDTDDNREKLIDSHLRSVRAHIKELVSKKYQDYLGEKAADFVMMFIPNEGAYIAAMQASPSLWQEAYDGRVLIVSPTHLVSALKLIAQLWSHDRQTRNALEIARQAGNLYDKFKGFIDDMASIEKSIDNAHKAYDAAMNKLSKGTGNLISRVENLRKLGAKTTKQLKIAEDSEE